jgi:hypothetical protein
VNIAVHLDAGYFSDDSLKNGTMVYNGLSRFLEFGLLGFGALRQADLLWLDTCPLILVT